ncbi:hypothetical protein N7495_008003 [Penicillium taxi]|uniref:uncharacterized protein n=1 Tax=Penicillium taxi TaxID=168475 RepID=UPI002545871A|nr:uncharacterized protein N7495_008003 [Penicillium taxi]KAJ5887962.1 hypothetical protein N7495_008003 [Penicillium taxi]
MTTPIVITIGPIVTGDTTFGEATSSAGGCSGPECIESTSTVVIPCTTDVNIPVVHTETPAVTQAPYPSSNGTVPAQATGTGIGAPIVTVTCPDSPQCAPAPPSAATETVICHGSSKCAPFPSHTVIHIQSTLSATGIPISHQATSTGNGTVSIPISTSGHHVSTSIVTEPASPFMTLVPSMAVMESCRVSTMFGALALVFLLTTIL